MRFFSKNGHFRATAHPAYNQNHDFPQLWFDYPSKPYSRNKDSPNGSIWKDSTWSLFLCWKEMECITIHLSELPKVEVEMNTGGVIGLVIIGIVSAIMIGIGCFQMKQKNDPVSFYTSSEPIKKAEISNIIQWNKQHGRLWIGYGFYIIAGYILAQFTPGKGLKLILLMGSILIPLPVMMVEHYKLEQKYRVNGSSKFRS